MLQYRCTNAVCYLPMFVACVMALAMLPRLLHAQEADLSKRADELFAKDNLVAWCIVPFDSAKRNPEQRATMLDGLGINKLAYDYRAEHIASFEEEITTLQKHNIDLFAWWFPGGLNDEAKLILSLLEKHRVKTQLWVTGGGDPNMSEADATKFIESEAQRIKPIAEAAQKIGCKVGLYNHGGWFGIPENQIKIIQQLGMSNIGIVYNLHHAHDQLDRLPTVLEKMQPYLIAVNLNGMRTDGDRLGHKILPIGEGDRDTEILKIILRSPYRGPIGILNHTGEDAKARLEDNLEGLSWTVNKVLNKEATSKPAWRSYRGEAVYDPGLVKSLVQDSQSQGDKVRGLQVFALHGSACQGCHKIGTTGGAVGPALHSVGTLRTPEHIVTSLLWPNRDIEPAFQTTQLLVEDGRVIRGYLTKESDTSLTMKDPTSGKELSFEKSEIEDRKITGSAMPGSLVTSLNRQQQLDLIAFVISLGKADGIEADKIATVLAHAGEHKVADFPFDNAPLNPSLRPDHKATVNRDRIYDYYTKQAEYFRTVDRESELFVEFPGMDGVKFGHWGNQNEEYWSDASWNDVVFDTVQCNVLFLPNKAVPRAVVFKLEEKGVPYTVCFNPDSLQYDAIWKDGFVKFSAVRHGFMDGMRPNGTHLEPPLPITHASSVEYRGFTRTRNDITFLYEIQGKLFLDTASIEDGKLVRNVKETTQESLVDSVSKSERQSPVTIETEIALGTNKPYAIDTIALPSENPWKIPLYCGDHDFLSDGSAMVATMHGDVWHVTGFSQGKLGAPKPGDDGLFEPQASKAKWHRYATGLHQPLGLVVHNDTVYVLGRNQITRLHDLNHDGQADWYECFSNKMETSPAGHDFICGLQRDKEGNFYTASGNQGLLKISADGKQATVLATGFRNPDGLGLLADGSITVPCSEGDWTPASMICLWRPESNLSVAGKPTFFGYKGPKVGGRPELPLIYLPRGVDNSSGGQVPVTSDRWGPLNGGAVHLSYGATTAMSLMIDEVNGKKQGAIMALPGEFKSGGHRGRFSPSDGQLYVTGMNGWGCYAPDTGCFQRVRYTGHDVPVPTGFHVHSNGIAVRFSDPVSTFPGGLATILNQSNYLVQAWNYRYSSAYGSAEYSTIHRNVRGHDRVPISSVQALDDDRTLFFELPTLQPSCQVHLRMAIGDPSGIDIFATCLYLDKPRTDFKAAQLVAKTTQELPIELDLALMARSKPNPWRTKLDNARKIPIAAGQNLSFTEKELRVKRDEPIALVFRNPDVVPHNWALVKPGKLNEIGDLANRFIGDPEAVIEQYVPKSSDVLCYTDVVEGQQSMTIYFKAPSEKGRYPYLCTFPGHWMVMNGELVVED